MHLSSMESTSKSSLNSFPGTRRGGNTGIWGDISAIATSDEENWWLTTLARERGLDSLWLGVTDEKVEGTWVCVDGTPMRYSHWDVAVKQPNNKQGLEHYVVLIVARDGMWSDQPDASSQHHTGFAVRVGMQARVGQ